MTQDLFYVSVLWLAHVLQQDGMWRWLRVVPLERNLKNLDENLRDPIVAQQLLTLLIAART
jgi:hypothetical protein